MAKKADNARKVIDAALELAAEQGWRETSLAAVAQRAGLSLAEVYRHFPGRGAILEGLARQVDAAVLSGGEPDLEERPRDRLFDVLMRRFDALTPYKPGLRVIWEETRRNPLPGLATAAQLRRSMAWMLEAAGLSAPGFRGLLLSKGLTAVWVATLRTWFEDDSEDLAKTMAALDANLRRAEEVWNSLPGRRAPPGDTAEAAAP